MTFGVLGDWLAAPEASFIATVHGYLPVHLHREKMHNAYRSGTADVWYSGAGGDLWVEYKYLRSMPERAPIRVYDMISPLQMRWLNERYDEGRHVVVILGVPYFAWLYKDRAWQSLDVTRMQILARGLDRKGVAAYIKESTCVESTLHPLDHR